MEIQGFCLTATTYYLLTLCLFCCENMNVYVIFVTRVTSPLT